MPSFYADATETLAVFWDGRPHTRAELQRLTGRARNTVTKHLDALSRHCLITDAGKDGAVIGRPSERFVLNAEAGALVVAQVDDADVRLTVADLTGRARGRGTVRLPAPVEPHRIAAGVRRAVAEFMCGAPVLAVLLTEVGAAHVDPGQLSDELAVPVYRRPWAELALTSAGPEAVAGTVLCVDADRTVRVTMLLDGTVVGGDRGLAGKVGSLVMPSREFALGAACRRSLDEVLAVARRNADDPRVQLAAGRHLGQAVAAFCRIVDPGSVLVSGHPAHNRAFLTGMRDAVSARLPWGRVGAASGPGQLTVRPITGELPEAIARGGCAEARHLMESPAELDRVLRTMELPGVLRFRTARVRPSVPATSARFAVPRP